MDSVQTTAKFKDPFVTAKGEQRAFVDLVGLKTLWFNTGTRCNLTCTHCYIESSPHNDRLAYIGLQDVTAFLDEIEAHSLPTEEIGFTGGEPLINPQIIPILNATLERGFRVLVLTNAFKVIGRHKQALLDLKARFPGKLLLRISLDHYTAEKHDSERGPGSFAATLKALQWLHAEGFEIGIAGRSLWGEPLDQEREGYRRLLRDHGVAVDFASPKHFIIFPEMDGSLDVPEITTGCWDILHKDPGQIMCAESRMVVRRRGADRPVVLACTLIAYEEAFELGENLTEARPRVQLNHPHCAKFCVLGGASCSGN